MRIRIAFLSLLVTASALLKVEAAYSQWEQTNIQNSISITAFAVQGNLLFAGGQPAYSYDTAGHVIHPFPSIYRSEDSGLTWVSSDTGLRGLTVETLWADDSILFAGTDIFNIFCSSDNGFSWQQVDSVENWQGIQFITSIIRHKNYYYATAEDGSGFTTILRSTDRGRTWKHTPGGGGGQGFLSQNDSVIVAAFISWILISNDDGNSWVKVCDVIQPSSLLVRDSFVLVSWKYGFERSSDNGYHWQGLSNELETSFLASNDGIVFLGKTTTANIEISYSRDYGGTWIQVAPLSQPGQTLKALFISQNYLFASGEKFEPPICRMPLSGLSNVHSNAPIHTFLQNSPNPFTQTTTVHFTLPTAAFASIKVYDISGREIAAIVSKTFQAGENEVIFDAKGLPGGVYFYRIETGSGRSEARSFVLMP